MKHKEANPEILFQYAEKLEHGGVFKRLGFLAEKIMHLPEINIEIRFIQKSKPESSTSIHMVQTQDPSLLNGALELIYP